MGANTKTSGGRTRRRAFWPAAALLGAMIALAGCGGSGDGGEAADGKLSVVTSFYPLYYFASEIGGEHVQVVNLVPAGVEPHDWSPKSQDLVNASNAGLFLYNGAGLEGWVDDFLEGLDSNSRVVTVEASRGIQLIEGDADGHEHGDEHADEVDDGHEHGDDHGHADDHAHEENEGHEHADEAAHADEHADEAHGHDHGHGVDPHTWVSPKSALIMAANVKDSLVQSDEANRESYERNFEELKRRLTELDETYAAELSALPKRDIVVSHQAFGYLCRDYGLNQVAIMGLSPEAEPRAQDLLAVKKFVEDNDIRYIFFEELVSPVLAETLANEAKVETLVLNPLEGLTPEQEAKGDNYVTIMESNLQNLKKALQ